MLRFRTLQLGTSVLYRLVLVPSPLQLVPLDVCLKSTRMMRGLCSKLSRRSRLENAGECENIWNRGPRQDMCSGEDQFPTDLEIQ